MTAKSERKSESAPLTYHDLNSAKLESVPAKSPHRKYLVLLAMHLVHSDDPQLLSEAADCSERTFHYVKSRLRKHDGVILNYDRGEKRYVVIQSGVLNLPKVAELLRHHYPRRYAYIEELSAKTRALVSDGQESGYAMMAAV